MATPTITWYYWDGDSWVDFTAYVLTSYGVNARWGMIDNKYTDRLANPGEMHLTVKNENGEFDPDDTSVLTGWAINTKVKLSIAFDGTDWVKYYGAVTDIKFGDPSTYEHTATITVSDWMDNAYRFTIDQQSIQTNQRGGQVVDTIVTATGKTPIATAYDEGDYRFKAAFDSMTLVTKAATELNKIVLSEGGYFYNRHDKTNGETLVFESASHRNGLSALSQIQTTIATRGKWLLEGGDGYVLTEEGGKVILDERTDATFTSAAINYHRTHGDNILNKITVTAYPKRTDKTTQVLYSLGDVIQVSSGGTKVIDVRYQNSVTREYCNAITSTMIQPVANTDYKMNTAYDGTGTDITSYLTVSVAYHTAEAKITLTNTSAYTGNITLLQLRGLGVYQDSSIRAVAEDSASQTNYGHRELNIEQQYQRDTESGELWADKILEKEKTPRTVLNRVDFIANKSDSLMIAFLSMDVGDMVKITESTLSLADYYYIHGIEFNIESGDVISFSWLLSEAEPSVTNGGLTLASVEFTYNSGQVIRFSGINKLTESYDRTVIFDVYPTLTNDSQTVFQFGVTDQNHLTHEAGFIEYDSGDNFYFRYMDFGYSEQGYEVEFDNCIKQNTWQRIAFRWKYKYTAYIPGCFVNGINIPIFTYSVIGYQTEHDKSSFFIGGDYTIPLTGEPYYWNSFAGKIKNFYGYNRLLTDLEIAADAAGTLVTDGLVFRGLAIPTNQADAYYDAALTTSQPLHDDINGALGIPYGAPTCREII